MLTQVTAQLDLGALAHVLFASPLQPSQRPSPEAIKTAIQAQLRASHGDPALSVRLVAQEAGDRPDVYVTRMKWARRSVASAYSHRLTVPAQQRFAA